MTPDQSNSLALETKAKGIADIMASLLRVKEVSVSSDFFALGGNSLLSAQLLFRIQQEYQVALSIKDIFEAKTPQRLTEWVHERLSGGDGPERKPSAAPGAALAEPPPVSLQSNESVPVTPQQRSIWLLEQRPAGKGISNVALVFTYAGALDGQRLELCVRELVDRHPMLRTTFSKQGPTVVQRSRKFVSIPQRLHDLRGLPADEQAAALKEIQAEEISRPFDLERDAMVRLTHLQLGDEEGVLLFLFHHIAVDERSLEIFFDQLQTLYDADDPKAVAPRGRSYLDYCREESEQETLAGRADSLQFWRVQLDGASHTAYPALGSTPQEQPFAGRHHYHALPRPLTDAIDAAAAKSSTTPFVVFAAGITYLLHRATGQEDICVASLMSRRDYFTDENVIGCFVNSVPLRTRIRRGDTLKQLLESVAVTFLNAYANRHADLEELEDVGRGGEPKEGNRDRPWPVTINLESEKVEELDLGGARLRREVLDRGIAKRDLTLSLRKVDGSYRVLVEYRSDRYDAAQVELLTGNLQCALEQLVSTPDSPLGAQLLAPPRALPTLPGALGWSRPDQYAPATVPELFRQAKRGREAKIALASADGTMTYGNLDAYSDAVASALIKRGVPVGALVAVVESRQVETMGALLGIWKAGAGYVVIDGAQPAETLEKILGACRPAVLLGQGSSLEALPPLGIDSLALEEASATPVSPTVVERSQAMDVDTTAYVCFTSGSSGVPKGVEVSQASITRVVRQPSYAAVSSDDVFLNISPLSFDGSVFEVWAPLANGATLRLIEDGTFSLDQVATALDEACVSVLFLTTRLLNALIDKRPETLLLVPTILFGGEKASREHVERLLASGYAGNLRNMYGPTETTVFATSHAVTRESLDHYSGEIPIGRAHNDTSIAVLDTGQAPVPCGVVGEIAIGGPGVAKGYVNDPQLTAAKFIQLDLPGQDDKRLYLSGDLGYFDEDGEIHFVRRSDRQVKVSGYRIELDEVESVIGSAPGVSGCHCLADEDLLAFVEHDDQRSSCEAVKAYVCKHLPAYKVPTRFVFTPRLPLNKNGKVDTDALEQLRQQGNAGAAPTSSSPGFSALIRQVWNQELGNDDFGDDDNFFDVGGTSLKIMLVHEELSKLLRERGVATDIEITHLFEFTTVSSLADFLERPSNDSRP